MSISSPTHHCPQIDEIESSASSDTTSMEKKPSHDLHHHQPQLHQQALKCPRCDSSNTKFCYYNNYSLSQPRHFCKGCKRYWTRGGTLRNVPIGGGCRKNKRVKRSATSSPSSTPAPVPLPTLSSSTTHTTVKGVNSMIYNQSADIPLNLARLSSTGYDNVESQFNAFQFGFSSPNMIASTLGGCGYASQGYDSCKEYKNEIHPTTLSNDVVTSNSILPNFPFFLGSSSSSSTTCLIPTNLQQYSFNLGGLKETRPTNNIQGSFNDQMAITKEVKVEDGGKEIIQSPMEQMGLLDLSAAYWNSMNAGAWADLSHYGSSVTSLI